MIADRDIHCEGNNPLLRFATVQGIRFRGPGIASYMDMKFRLSLEDDKEPTVAIRRGSTSQKEEAR